jgi:formate hydrogenlyase subunit 3/multisubunit Na+/H+ antiporter MnhD subunit
MSVTAAVSGLWVALVTVGAALLISLDPTSRTMPLSWAVTLLASAAGGVALLTDHFLTRYAALEIVALCVALAPLVELGGEEGTRLTRWVYLLLRVGDAGLLGAILLLGDAVGTLLIAPALAAGESMVAGRLEWAVAGFLLAVWVKLGGWPFHTWSQVGRRLAPVSHGWLYGILVPNLGAYLLYRIQPLLAASGPLQTAALWCSGGAAVLSAFFALLQTDPRDALEHLSAVQAGLLLFAAAACGKPALWLVLVVLTPVRLLLFLTLGNRSPDSAETDPSGTAGGRLTGICTGIAGLALVILGLLLVRWGRAASPGGAALPAAFIVEAALGMVIAWTMRAVWQLSHSPTATREAVPRVRRIVTGLVSGGAVVAGIAFEPLARHLTGAVHVTLPPLPTFPALLAGAVASPVPVAGVLLGLASLRLRRWVGRTVAIDLMSTAVSVEAEVARAVELGLEGVLQGVVQAVRWSSRMAQAVERGLEDGLVRLVRHIYVGGRRLQCWHTGRLRRNLLWLPVALGLAVLLAVVGNW